MVDRGHAVVAGIPLISPVIQQPACHITAVQSDHLHHQQDVEAALALDACNTFVLVRKAQLLAKLGKHMVWVGWIGS